MVYRSRSFQPARLLYRTSSANSGSPMPICNLHWPGSFVILKHWRCCRRFREFNFHLEHRLIGFQRSPSSLWLPCGSTLSRLGLSLPSTSTATALLPFCPKRGQSNSAHSATSCCKDFPCQRTKTAAVHASIISWSNSQVTYLLSLDFKVELLKALYWWWSLQF